jgi:hypothetical protein
MFAAVMPPVRNGSLNMNKGIHHGKVRMRSFFQLIEINGK